MQLSFEQTVGIGLRFVLDLMQPKSPYGRTALKKLAPFARGRADACRQELDNLERTITALAAHPRAFARLGQIFTAVKDIRASLERCAAGGLLDEVELFEIKRYLLQLEEIGPLFAEVDATAGYDGIAFEQTAAALDILDIDKSRVASFTVSERYSPALAAARRDKKQAEQALRTVTDAAEQKSLTAQRQRAVAAEQAEEEKVCAELSRQLVPHIPAMLHNTHTIARLDLLAEKAALATEWGAVKPEVGGDVLLLEETFNPMVASGLKDAGKHFTPISIELGRGATVITGANMGGKSVALKTVALNAWLAQCGFYAFAKAARCPLFDGIQLVSDDLEDVARGLSSFGGEMVALNAILDRPADSFALLLLDEFARGTNPHEGAAIAQTVAQVLNARGDIAVMTTHFEGVAAFAGAHYQVAGLAGANMARVEKQLAGLPAQNRVRHLAGLMDYRLLPVRAGVPLPKDALAICRLLGVSDEIVAGAEKKLLTIDKGRVK